MDINQAAVGFLKKLFPSRLVGLEVEYNQLPTNLMVKVAYKQLTNMEVEPNIDTEAAIKLQLTGYNTGPMGPTAFFQELEHIKFQLTQTNVDNTLTRSELSDNVIKIIALAAFRKCSHLQQNIELIEAAWKKADADFDTANSATEIMLQSIVDSKPIGLQT